MLIVAYCPPYIACHGIDLGAGLEQCPRDFDGIRRRLLPVALDAVGGDIVKQGRGMHWRILRRSARRPRPDQLRVVMQQGLKSGEVAVDDGLDSRLEPEDRAIDADSVDVFVESRPVRKGIPASQREPRVVEIEGRLLNVGAGHEFRPPGDRLVQKARVVLVDDPNRFGVPGAMSPEQLVRLTFVILES